MQTQNIPATFNFLAAAQRLSSVVYTTPLELNRGLSAQFECNVFLKREDLQVVRSYKIRGAYNLMSSLLPKQLQQGVVCASAGNHAQGFAYSCKKLGAKGIIFMPTITPGQKLQQTKMFGEGFIEIRLTGDNFDECATAAKTFADENALTFVPPFNDERIIEGQGTVALEMMQQFAQWQETLGITELDYVFAPVGGGGLTAGIGAYLKTCYPGVKLIGVEPGGAPSMTKALQAGHPVMLHELDRFIDGAAVKQVGDLTFAICKEVIHSMQLVPEGQVCSTILKLYNEEAIVVEPAGALSIAALYNNRDLIKGKNIVCIVSGSNNDIDRMPEIKERSLQYEGLKHYYLVNFAQRPGALKEFVNDVLGPNDDITRFEYMQKTNKESGPALIGIELKDRADHAKLVHNMQAKNINYTELNKDHLLFGYLI